jgi:hypothetical protein
MCEDSTSFALLRVHVLAYLPHKVFKSVRAGFVIFVITTDWYGVFEKNQNPRIVRSGYLKNVKEFSGFFKASEGLTVCRRLLGLFHKTENHNHI